MSLLVINYAMDEDDNLLSHQVEVVNAIACKFQEVEVLTGRIGKLENTNNFLVSSYNWNPGKNLSNAVGLLKIFFQIIKFRKPVAIFSHMTLYQSIILLPLSKFFRIKHYVWFAHKSKNKFLSITYRLFDGIFTSTLDSCPIKSSKVYAIGQTINSKKFPAKNQVNFPINKLIHIGRFDPIKKIELIIEAVSTLRINYPNLSLSIIGSASTDQSKLYERQIKDEASKFVSEGWLRFSPSIKRESIPSLLAAHDCFIHACDAAIDKVILEATISKLPVVSINNEFLKQFGSWSRGDKDFNLNLQGELESLLKSNQSDLINTIEKRYRFAMENHELGGWVDRLLSIMQVR